MSTEVAAVPNFKKTWQNCCSQLHIKQYFDSHQVTLQQAQHSIIVIVVTQLL